MNAKQSACPTGLIFLAWSLCHMIFKEILVGESKHDITNTWYETHYNKSQDMYWLGAMFVLMHNVQQPTVFVCVNILYANCVAKWLI